MKKTITIIAAAMAFMCISINTLAHKGCGDDWKERIMSEKIAYLTVEIGLTPEEAQTFWPVYNQVEQGKDEAIRKTIHAYRELNKAVEEGKSTKEISALLDNYLAAQKNLREYENGIADKYKSALPADKVARLYVAEEKFRRQQIRNLHNRGERPEPRR